MTLRGSVDIPLDLPKAITAPTFVGHFKSKSCAHPVTWQLAPPKKPSPNFNVAWCNGGPKMKVPY